MPEVTWTTSCPIDGSESHGIGFGVDDGFVLVRESSEPALALHLTRQEADGFLRDIEAGKRFGTVGKEVTVYETERGIAICTCSAEIQTTIERYDTFIVSVLKGNFDRFKL